MCPKCGESQDLKYRPRRVGPKHIIWRVTGSLAIWLNEHRFDPDVYLIARPPAWLKGRALARARKALEGYVHSVEFILPS